MRIIIKENGKKAFNFRLPLSLLKSKFFTKYIAKKSNGVYINTKELSKIVPSLYKEIRKYIKLHGHFNLVEIESKDSSEVIIKL